MARVLSINPVDHWEMAFDTVPHNFESPRITNDYDIDWVIWYRNIIKWHKKTQGTNERKFHRRKEAPEGAKKLQPVKGVGYNNQPHGSAGAFTANGKEALPTLELFGVEVLWNSH
jgi:hypothetical protein